MDIEEQPFDLHHLRVEIFRRLSGIRGLRPRERRETILHLLPRALEVIDHVRHIVHFAANLQQEIHLRLQVGFAAERARIVQNVDRLRERFSPTVSLTV